MNKIIMAQPNGKEQLICESIDTYHATIIVALLNGSYATKARKVNYKIVPHSHTIKDSDWTF